MDGTFAVTLGKQTVWGPRQPQQAVLLENQGKKKETKDKMPRARKLPCGHWPTQPTGPQPFLPKYWVRLAEPQEDPPLLGETLSQPQKGHPSSCSGTASAWERAVPFPVLQPLEWGVPPPLCKTFRDWALLLLLPDTPPTLLGPADPRDGWGKPSAMLLLRDMLSDL